MWVLGLLLLQTITAPQDAASTAVVEVGARGYRADGRSSGIANDSGRDGTAGYVWSDGGLCTFGASAAESTTIPAVGWHFSAHVTQRNGDESVVHVEWQRLWENSTRVAAPRGASTDVRLRLGDRLELNHVVPTIPGQCQTEILRLEVAIAPRVIGRGFGAGGGGVSGTGAGAARAGGAGGSALGLKAMPSSGAGALPAASVAAPLPIGPGVQTDEDVRLRASAMLLAIEAQVARAKLDANVSARLDELRQLINGPRFDAEVWLVHRSPNGTEEVQRQPVTFASRASVVFAQVPIASARGTVNVDVTAVLQMAQAADQPPLELTISRRIRAGGQPPVDNAGSSNRRMDLPKPGAVLSFVLPEPVGSTSDLLAGHTFELRLRIAPQARPRGAGLAF